MKPENKTEKELSSEIKESLDALREKIEDNEVKLPEESLQRIKEKTDEALKDSYEYAMDLSQKIDKNIRDGIQKTKESSIVQYLRAKAEHLRTMDDKEKNKHKRKIVRILVKIRDNIFEIFEKFVGRIRIGTQYGKSSIDLLSDLAKLKELGIITEKEFEAQKKEIIGRI